MKIAAQNVFLVAPIFLVLALMTTLLLFFSERREVQWGLDNEAQGIAQTIAEFTDGATLSGRHATLTPLLERIAKFGQALRIEIVDTASGRAVRVAEAGEPARPAAMTFDDDTVRRVLRAEAFSQTTHDRHDRLAAYAPILDAASQVRGIVAVETNLAPLHSHRNAVFLRTAIISLGLLAVGCVVSLIISTIISGEIGRLTSTARAFASGDYDARFEPGSIEEVAVVGSTFGIMGSVLRDATERSTREMLQLERFNTDADLMDCYAERFAAPVADEQDGVRVAIDRLGPPVHGDFWFAASQGAGRVACLGRLDAPPSLDALTTASAAGIFIRDGLAAGSSIPDVLAQAADLFPIHCCMVVDWGTPGGTFSVHRLDRSGHVEHTSVDPPAGRTIVLTTLDEAADRKAVRYAAAYSFDAPAVCVSELQRFLGAVSPGGLLALQVG